MITIFFNVYLCGCSVTFSLFLQFITARPSCQKFNSIMDPVSPINTFFSIPFGNSRCVFHNSWVGRAHAVYLWHFPPSRVTFAWSQTSYHNHQNASNAGPGLRTKNSTSYILRGNSIIEFVELSECSYSLV